MVKKACPREGGGSAWSPAQSQGRQNPQFHGQGRSPFGAQSVLPVREPGNMARTPLVAFFTIPSTNTFVFRRRLRIDHAMLHDAKISQADSNRVTL
ncbi:MAG: hypothetical protein VST68_13515 [Nitrospirota bacterium]|nr:hypothetical protein [Nitrospirota bacterium]